MNSIKKGMQNFLTQKQKNINNIEQDTENTEPKYGMSDLQKDMQSIKDMQNVKDSTLSSLEKDIQYIKDIKISELENDIIRIKDLVNHLPADLRKLKKDILKPVLWNNESQRRVLRANGWDVIEEQNDFEKIYLDLIRGMDEESVCAVNKILIRNKLILNSDAAEIDLFTQEEQEELKYVREHFNKQIFQISDSLWAWRNYVLPYNHFESSVLWYHHGIERVNNLDYIHGKTIVDVGGYIGDSVLVLSRLDAKSIVTFEADPVNYNYLLKTIELNQVPNVKAENLALGKENGTITLHTGDSSSTIIERPGVNYTGDIEVPIITLDEYVEKNNLEIGLIKVDIEGAEPDFLQGAKKTICSQKPIILLSIYHNPHDFFFLKPMIESWNLGYTFKIYKPTLKNTTSETMLIIEPK